METQVPEGWSHLETAECQSRRGNVVDGGGPSDMVGVSVGGGHVDTRLQSHMGYIN